MTLRNAMELSESEHFAVLWTKAHPTVSAYVSSLVPNFHQAEDVLNQVAVTLVRKFHQYDVQRPFVNWAIGVAKFEVLKYRRTWARDRLVFSEDLVEEISVTYQKLSADLDDQRSLLRQCLEKVEGRSRRAIQLRYFEDLKPADIAEKLSMASGAVRVLLHRVRVSIRKCMEQRFAETEVEK